MTEINSNNPGRVNLSTVPSNAASVQVRIESMQDRVMSLSQTVQALIAELQALQPPSHPGEGAKPEQVNAYNQAMAQYQNQLNNLNNKIASTQRDLAVAQNDLQRLMSADMPAAQRKDAKEMDETLKRETEALDVSVRSTATSQTDQTDNQIEVRVLERRGEIRSGDLKIAINFLMLTISQNGGMDAFAKTLGTAGPVGRGLPTDPGV